MARLRLTFVAFQVCQFGMTQVGPYTLEGRIQLLLHPCVVDLETRLAPTPPGDLAEDAAEGIADCACDRGTGDCVYSAAPDCPNSRNELDQFEYYASPNHRAVDPGANLLLLDHGIHSRFVQAIDLAN